MFYNVSNEKKLKAQAEGTLDEIIEKINSLEEGKEGRKEIPILTPKDWNLVFFHKFLKKPPRCKEGLHCICICEESNLISCNERNICESLEDDVFFVNGGVNLRDVEKMSIPFNNLPFDLFVKFSDGKKVLYENELDYLLFDFLNSKNTYEGEEISVRELFEKTYFFSDEFKEKVGGSKVLYGGRKSRDSPIYPYFSSWLQNQGQETFDESLGEDWYLDIKIFNEISSSEEFFTIYLNGGSAKEGEKSKSFFTEDFEGKNIHFSLIDLES